ncbi:hypothetical protein ACNKHM_04520 [Shigella sonnei]
MVSPAYKCVRQSRPGVTQARVNPAAHRVVMDSASPQDLVQAVEAGDRVKRLKMTLNAASASKKPPSLLDEALPLAGNRRRWAGIPAMVWA